MSAVEEVLERHLDRAQTRPFLFVGSGFSRRYLGLETWTDLLRLFASEVGEFEYYLSAFDSHLPRTAGLIARDYAEFWWKHERKIEEREKHRKTATRSSSPLKIAISEHISQISDFDLSASPYQAELKCLSGLSADGIITTNWDLLLESLFPSYRVFIGQKSIVTQTPQNIGEIYKIHGCCSDPNSLVLTQDDYEEFDAKRAYLAAKLITIFVEHPVIFLGYSVSDSNIISLLKAIVRGLGQSELERLRDNLIFVQRSKSDRPVGVKETVLVVEDLQRPVVQVIADDFEKIYKAIGKQKRKLPASVLRFCKEQLYRITSESKPNDKLCLVDFDDIDDHSEVEFVVGLGIAKQQLGQRGYRAVGAAELFGHLLHEDKSLDCHMVLSQTLTEVPQGRRFLPVFCFLNGRGIRSSQDYKASEYQVDQLVNKQLRDFQTNGYQLSFARDCKNLTTAQIIEKFPPDRVTLMLPWQPFSQINTDALKDFLVEHELRLVEGSYTSFFRKLACLYDRLKYGWL